ncbi:LTA synthase family protein [Granulicatella seriolae]|uniref:Sulfatase-like hydrolase/transferase n=1 Tax=Granulicatella seriolae TaxID=2967226 RepID=A0ABT1WN45_9LACT|nr:alkaline phosphatase family protein [Granulicatella seriolae]
MKLIKKYFMLCLGFLAIAILAFSFKDEFMVGQGSGELRFVATSSKNEESQGFTQTVTGIFVNGYYVNHTDFRRSTWINADSNTLTEFYTINGDNNEVVIPISQAQNLTYDYFYSYNGGVLQVFLDNKLLESVDTYSPTVSLESKLIQFDSSYGLSWHAIFMGVILSFFIVVIIQFYKKNILSEITKKEWLYLGIILISAVLAIYFSFFYMNRPYIIIHTSIFSMKKLIVTLPAFLFLLFMTMKLWSHSVAENIKIRKWINKLIYLVPIVGIFVLENSYNYLRLIGKEYYLANYLIVSLLMFTLTLVFMNRKAGAIVTLLICLVAGIVNKMMIDVRDMPLQYYHLKQFRDAANVADVVNIEFDNQIIISIVITLAFVLFILFLPVKPYEIHWLKRIPIMVIMTVAAYFIFPSAVSIIANRTTTTLNFWKMYQTYSENGAALSFVDFYNQSKLTVPEGYSVAKVDEILEGYTSPQPTTQQPNIILIQNESQMDVMRYRDDFVSPDPMAFQHSLAENTIHGDLYVSVFGGGTANTEYEVLTSNSLAILPPNTFPYQQLITENRSSYARLLGSFGYDTIALHPNNRRNYNRDKVWNYLGFDKQYFFDSTPDLKSLFPLSNERMFVSDKSLFEGVASLYDKKTSNKPMFTFVVTMQGHGGYQTGAVASEVQVGVNAKGLEAENEYFTSVKKTDEAFAELVSHFQKYPEPTVIIMYGDHQPALSQVFYSSIFTGDYKENKYVSPFVVWANFDIPESSGVPLSPNYLIPYTIDRLKESQYPLNTSAFYNFLAEMEKGYPVMTTWGYFDADGNYHENVDETGLYHDYQLIQYNRIKDEKILTVE